ncbi:hypothetical protein [Helicobacter macacae]|nr:hypothetical protein [Helicobacter macacae]
MAQSKRVKQMVQRNDTKQGINRAKPTKFTPNPPKPRIIPKTK